MKHTNYTDLLTHIKSRILEAQVKTISAANSQMLLLYWQMGNYILANQKAKGWGASIIKKLAVDLKKEFPLLKGFSARNLLYMKQFATAYPIAAISRFVVIETELKNAQPISQQLVAKLLLVDNEELTITQQPVAQLKKGEIPITQQPAAQLKKGEIPITQQPAAQLKKGQIPITQQPVAQLKKGKIPITQQPVAQLKKGKNLITQQPVAQLKKGKNLIPLQPDERLGEDSFLASIIARLSWSHHIVLMDKEPHIGKRFWYMLNSLEHGNSRNVLGMQIESGLFERQVTAKKISNFSRTLPPPQSDFANYLFKDPYIFDFVQAKEKADERNIEEQLAQHIQKFLLELGQGFAFVGRQVHFEIGEQDFATDLLFYHTRLHCYVVVELKARPFEAGDAGKLNFYINVVNDKLKTKGDNDTIGMLLCRGKSEVLAEYALKGYNNAIGVTDYQLSKALPKALQSQLPNIEDLENELQKNKVD